MKINSITKWMGGILAVTMLALWPDSGFAQSDVFRIVVFGDSLTSGYQLRPEQAYPARLLRKLQETGFANIEVLNMSVAGETTAEGAGRLGAVIDKHPDIVVVEFGMNDILQGIKPEIISRNVTTIVSQLVSRDIYVVLMGIAVPKSVNNGYGYSQQVNAVYAAIGHLNNNNRIAFYPDALQGISGVSDMTFGDGIHPSAKGVDAMVEGSYRLVDYALRWKMYVRQYQEYQLQQ